ncbi:MAG: PAS domain S-box protein, partial [Blastocatellia bacterium]
MNRKKMSDPKIPTIIQSSSTLTKVEALEFKESENKYRSFIENLPVLFYAVDSKPPYRPLYVSPAFSRFGYPMETWLNDPDIWIKVIHEDDREWVFNQTKVSTKTGEEVDYEYRVIDAEGEIHWVRDRGCLIRDTKGQVVCREGVILDITARKQTEEALSQSEKRFRNLFENANDIIYVHDLSGNYLSMNQAAERVFGYSCDEALKLNMSEIVAPEHLELARRMLAEKLSGHTKQTAYELDCVRKDGTRLTLEVNSTVMLKDGVPVAVQGIARDITERKLAEEKLSQSEEFNRGIINSSLDCIKTLDIDGKLLSMSSGGQSLLCITDLEPFLNKPWIEFWEGEDQKAAQAAIASAAAGETGRFVGFFRSLDGTPKWWDVQVSPIRDADGRPNRLLVVSRDITEQKRADRALQESEANLAAAQRITHLGSWELIVNNVKDANENTVRWS